MYPASVATRITRDGFVAVGSADLGCGQWFVAAASVGMAAGLGWVVPGAGLVVDVRVQHLDGRYEMSKNDSIRWLLLLEFGLN